MVWNHHLLGILLMLRRLAHTWKQNDNITFVTPIYDCRNIILYTAVIKRHRRQTDVICQTEGAKVGYLCKLALFRCSFGDYLPTRRVRWAENTAKTVSGASTSSMNCLRLFSMHMRINSSPGSFVPILSWYFELASTDPATIWHRLNNTPVKFLDHAACKGQIDTAIATFCDLCFN